MVYGVNNGEFLLHFNNIIVIKVYFAFILFVYPFIGQF